jgi:two-component system response regulator
LNSNIVDILLVEDDPRDAELTIMALREHNLINNIHHVKDGVEAMDYLLAQGSYSDRNPEIRPKLILLDLKLPRMSGLEVLQTIKSHNELKEIPIVVLTSSAMETDIVESYKLGVNSYIVKPVNFENFIESVRQIGYYWIMLNKIPTN